MMNRCEFIPLLGGTVAAWPLAARSQQDDRVRRIGFLSVITEGDPEGQTWIREFLQRLQELGWTNGRNVQVDFRYGGADATRTSMLAAELIELRPDVMPAAGLSAAGTLRQKRLFIPIGFRPTAEPD